MNTSCLSQRSKPLLHTSASSFSCNCRMQSDPEWKEFSEPDILHAGECLSDANLGMTANERNESVLVVHGSSATLPAYKLELNLETMEACVGQCWACLPRAACPVRLMQLTPVNAAPMQKLHQHHHPERLRPPQLHHGAHRGSVLGWRAHPRLAAVQNRQSGQGWHRPLAPPSVSDVECRSAELCAMHSRERLM